MPSGGNQETLFHCGNEFQLLIFYVALLTRAFGGVVALLMLYSAPRFNPVQCKHVINTRAIHRSRTRKKEASNGQSIRASPGSASSFLYVSAILTVHFPCTQIYFETFFIFALMYTTQQKNVEKPISRFPLCGRVFHHIIRNRC